MAAAVVVSKEARALPLTSPRLASPAQLLRLWALPVTGDDSGAAFVPAPAGAVAVRVGFPTVAAHPASASHEAQSGPCLNNS